MLELALTVLFISGWAGIGLTLFLFLTDKDFLASKEPVDVVSLGYIGVGFALFWPAFLLVYGIGLAVGRLSKLRS